MFAPGSLSLEQDCTSTMTFHMNMTLDRPVQHLIASTPTLQRPEANVRRC